MTSIEKNDWKTEYKQTKKKINTFEIDIIKLFPFLQTTTMKNEFILLNNNEEKLNFDRSKEREDIFINLSFLRKDIKCFKEKIKYFDKSEENLKKIEEHTLALETKMSDFQSKQMSIFDVLTTEEERFSTDLELFSSRLDSYENTQKLSENKQKKMLRYHSYKAIEEENDNCDDQENEYYDANASFISNKENINDENLEYDENPNQIENLDQELQKLKKNIEVIDRTIRNNGGIACNWPEEDHRDFLKLRTKHKNNINKAIFLEDCVSALPLYNKQDIQSHIDKFKIYCDLDNEKKGLVDNYKILKEERKRKMLRIIDEEQNQNQEKIKENAAERKEDREKQKKLKEQLTEWKRKKISMKEVNHEKILLEADKRKKQEEKRLQEKKAMFSEKLKEYKQSKDIEKIQKLQPPIKKTLDPFEIERIKLKEEQILNRKKELIEKKKSFEEEKKKRLEKLFETKQIKFSYVESKLNEETKTIIGKKTPKFDPFKGDQPKIADTFGGMIGKGPSRAIPSWRQGGK